MSDASRRLSPYCSKLFSVEQSSRQSPALRCPALEDFYSGFNGGYYWNRALLVRPPAEENTGSVMSVAQWNDPELWKGLYGLTCADIIFFGEDAFGGQFGIQRETVVQFDPETAAVVTCGKTLDEWAKLLIEQVDYFTGSPVLAAWEVEHSEIRAGHRLIPKQMFMLGGEFHSDNMLSRPDVEGMRIRGQIFNETKVIPDGQKVRFETTK